MSSSHIPSEAGVRMQTPYHRIGQTPAGKNAPAGPRNRYGVVRATIRRLPHKASQMGKHIKMKGQLS
jgi:hypothetical protein